MIYLDNAATTHVSAEALAVYNNFSSASGLYYNPSAGYSLAKHVRYHIDNARKNIGSILSADPSKIVFTSGATESNNLVLRGIAKAYGKNHFIVSEVEHSSVLQTARMLKEEGVIDLSIVEVQPSGEVLPDDVLKHIKDNTVLVSVMAVNNETGVSNDVKSIARICKQRGVIFHSDFTQLVGKDEIDIYEDYSDIDYITFSGHKFHAPKGVGVLLSNTDRYQLAPFITGGNQENGLRAGTYNVPAIMALSAALEQTKDTMGIFRKKCQNFINQIKTELETLPGVDINGHGYNIINFSCPGLDLASVEDEVILSRGSACLTEKAIPSHVIEAMVGEKRARQAVRVSISRYTTEEEIAKALKVIKSMI